MAKDTEYDFDLFPACPQPQVPVKTAGGKRDRRHLTRQERGEVSGAARMAAFWGKDNHGAAGKMQAHFRLRDLRDES